MTGSWGGPPDRRVNWPLRLLVGLILTACLWFLSTHPEPVGGAPAPQECTEDMDCWDCSTMGNLQCGPEPATHQPTYTG